MKNLLPTEGLRFDMSQFYPLKAVLEELLGHHVYLRLKETATLPDWKDVIQKLLRAINPRYCRRRLVCRNRQHS